MDVVQLIGDPRHSPYLDVKLNHGYNWYWIASGSMAGYSGFDRAVFGWGGNSYVEVDYPRACSMLRSGLLRALIALTLLAVECIELSGQLVDALLDEIDTMKEDIQAKESENAHGKTD